jgi:hypothetical protein
LLDLRTLNPYDWEAIATSIRKTSRVIVAHEDMLSWGYGAEIAARIGDELFDDLDAPVRRVGAMDTFVAYQPLLEEAILPQPESILKAIVEALKACCFVCSMVVAPRRRAGRLLEPWVPASPPTWPTPESPRCCWIWFPLAKAKPEPPGRGRARCLAKAKPAAFYEPALAALITPGNFEDDLPKLASATGWSRPWPRIWPSRRPCWRALCLILRPTPCSPPIPPACRLRRSPRAARAPGPLLRNALLQSAALYATAGGDSHAETDAAWWPPLPPLPTAPWASRWSSPTTRPTSSPTASASR